MVDHNVTVAIAASSPQDGMTSKKTTIQVQQPFVEVLIGSAFTSEDTGIYHEYGHAALRVVGDNKDITYDFGRYRRIKKLSLGAYGDGILRVWSDFSEYIARQNGLGRTTTGLVYYSTQRRIKETHEMYEQLYMGDADISQKIGKSDAAPIYAAYWLDDDYDIFHNNCVSKTVDGLNIARPGAFQIPLVEILLDGGPELEGISTKSKIGATLGTVATSVPKYGIYLPKDLENVLRRNKKIKQDVINSYAN